MKQHKRRTETGEMKCLRYGVRCTLCHYKNVKM